MRGADGHPGLGTVLPTLQGRHHKVLLREEHWTSGDLARHPEPRDIARSMRKLGNLDSHGRLVRTFEMQRRVTEDVRENRFVRHVVEEVERRLTLLPVEAEVSVLLRELKAARRLAPFLGEAGRLDRPMAEPTAVLSENPLYRAIYEIWRTVLRDAPSPSAGS
ncbi:MAG: DUF2357 domain-containing protein [Actinomycetota bacterium]|nr:DUF2357 domain-containing protein [Actinomycetota bacterium]